MEETKETPTQAAQATIPQPIPAGESKFKSILIGIAAVIFLGLLITGAVMLLVGEAETAAKWRDVFIIFIALEMLIIGVAIVLLMVQLAVLINLLQHEIRPILESTNDTVNTLKGTAEFLSKNVSEPVIKLNGYMAGLKRLIDLVVRPGQ
ncbi:MAG: hypothetical protein HPY85_01650 [Anaerolineae bacterium]|nr:hypothetical protein [Anaerolineae bacterium]